MLYNNERLDYVLIGRKRLLLILNAWILYSSVERGMPSRVAAPEGPNTRPPLARSASSIIAFS